MKKQLLIGAGILILLVGCISAFTLLKPAAVHAPTGENDTGSHLPPEGIFTQHATYFDVEAHYASTTPLAGTANTAATALMSRWVQDTIDAFYSDGDFDNLTAADIQALGFDRGRKESLKIVYLMGSSAHTVSYIYTIYTDTLGAHGNTDFRTFVFNTTTGSSVALSDLFLPGTDYLGTLSKLARARLPEIIGENFDMSMITDGTMPTADSFKNFFFDGTDFVVLFPPYQVAAYSEGPQTLRIPTALIANILKSEYR